MGLPIIFMKRIETKFIELKIPYSGKELRSHFIYDQFDLLGDALVAFAGPCDVSLEQMVDLEDVKLDAPIYSENMLHFIGEFYGISLETTITYQRLLIALMSQEMHASGFTKVLRQGDDLYEGDAKLSVSIATLSPTSTLIHAGINISSKNTPVKTKGLEDFKISPTEFAQKILKAFQEEFHDISKALCKVRSVP